MIVEWPDTRAIGMQAVITQVQRQVNPLGCRQPDDVLRGMCLLRQLNSIAMSHREFMTMRVQGNALGAPIDYP